MKKGRSKKHSSKKPQTKAVLYGGPETVLGFHGHKREGIAQEQNYGRASTRIRGATVTSRRIVFVITRRLVEKNYVIQVREMIFRNLLQKPSDVPPYGIAVVAWSFIDEENVLSPNLNPNISCRLNHPTQIQMKSSDLARIGHGLPLGRPGESVRAVNVAILLLH
ncbi:MAG: hypothetical protein ABSD38_07020 [Syntrophorhabdales bacterium]|jgi:hypothetical protein